MLVIENALFEPFHFFMFFGYLLELEIKKLKF